MPLPTCVPYDFDHAGIVRASYAQPAPELKMLSIPERRYREYCLDDLRELEPILDHFNALREDFYALYQNCPMLEDKYVRQTKKFLDVFYDTINNPKAVVSAFTYPCLENGTGKVVIQGLRKQK